MKTQTRAAKNSGNKMLSPREIDKYNIHRSNKVIFVSRHESDFEQLPKVIQDYLKTKDLEIFLDPDKEHQDEEYRQKVIAQQSTFYACAITYATPDTLNGAGIAYGGRIQAFTRCTILHHDVCYSPNFINLCDLIAGNIFIIDIRNITCKTKDNTYDYSQPLFILRQDLDLITLPENTPATFMSMNLKSSPQIVEEADNFVTAFLRDNFPEISMRTIKSIKIGLSMITLGINPSEATTVALRSSKNSTRTTDINNLTKLCGLSNPMQMRELLSKFHNWSTLFMILQQFNYTESGEDISYSPIFRDYLKNHIFTPERFNLIGYRIIAKTIDFFGLTQEDFTQLSEALPGTK